MRLSPDATRYVYVDGLEVASPVVTVVLETGVRMPLEPGHSPRWESNDDVVWGPQQDASVRRASDPTWAPADALPITPSGNTIDAAAGRWAVHRTDPLRVLSAQEPVQYHAANPVYSSAGAWRAVLLPDQPTPGVTTLEVARTTPGARRRALATAADARDPKTGIAVGGIRTVRAHGTTFIWEVEGGRIAGVRDVANEAGPVVAFPLPAGWVVYKPVPVWHDQRGELGVLFTADDGANSHIFYAAWDALAAGTMIGFPIGVSTGSGFDLDVKPHGRGVRVLYADPLGDPVVVDLDLDAPRVALTPPGVEPPIEPPVEPPEPEPGPDPGPEPGPEPLPPPTQEGIVIEFAELRNMEMRLEDTYCNHGKHPPVTYTIHVNQEGFVWRQHYWDRRKAGMSHEQAIRSVESDIDTIEGRPDRWATPPPEQGVAGPIAGPLGVDGRHFTVPD
jgi:hypothetical protein